MVTRLEPLVTTKEREDGKIDVFIRGELVESVSGVTPSQAKRRADEIVETANIINDQYFKDRFSLTPPMNVVQALQNQTPLRSQPTTFNKIFDVLQLQGVDRVMEKEADLYEKTVGVRTNLERYGDRAGYGEIEDQTDRGAGFKVNTIGDGTKTFRTREAAERYLQLYNELPNKYEAQSNIERQKQADNFLTNIQPEPEKTSEYEQQKQAALEGFRAVQKLRDYGGGPMDRETLIQKALTQAGVNTQALNPNLLKDQDFLRQLKDMGVNQIVTGGISSTDQTPTFNLLQITDAGIPDRNLLTTRIITSGQSFTDFKRQKGPSAMELFANVFWSPVSISGGGGQLVERTYDPSVAINTFNTFSDLKTASGSPGIEGFAAIAGISEEDAAYALMHDAPLGADLRDWKKILTSDDPYSAAIAARKAIEAKYPNLYRGLGIDPETNQVYAGDGASLSQKNNINGYKVLAKAGNFAVLQVPNSPTAQLFLFDPETNKLGPRESIWMPEDLNKLLTTRKVGTEGMRELAQQLANRSEQGASSIATGIERYLGEYGETQTPPSPTVDGTQYLKNIPDAWNQVLLNWSDELPLEEVNKLLRSEIVRYKDINTGELKEAVIPNNIISSKVERLEMLQQIGAIPDFDIKNFENLPNYPEDFERIIGRPVEVGDFEAYGYDDPQAAYDSIMSQQDQGQPTEDQQTQEVFGTEYAPIGQTYPTYNLPENYTGSGTTTTTGQTTGTEYATGTGQTNMYGTLPFQYTPTTTTQVGTSGTIGGTTQTGTTGQQEQQYTVRQFRNASGLTTSVTFVNGKPISNIPSGFYPVEQGAAQQQQQTTATETPTQQDQTTTGTLNTQQANVQQTPTTAGMQVAQTGTQPMYSPQMMQPVTYNMANGGAIGAQNTTTNMPMTGQFNGFKPQAMQRIANSLGYTGDMNNFNTFLQQNPAANERMNYYTNVARQMASGGYLKASNGADTTGAVATQNVAKVMPTALNQQYIPQQNFGTNANLPSVQAQIAKTPGLPTGATAVPVGTTLDVGQLVSPVSGQVSGGVALPTAQASTTAAGMAQPTQAAQVSTIESATAVNSALDTLQAAQGTLDPRAEVLAAQQTASSVGDVQAAQGNAILMDNPVQRQIQDGELISGAANAQTAATFTEQIEAATATPTKQATVQGQLEGLMAQFEGGNTPAWAAGTMRSAIATLSARGLGASSMAGQAVIQAAMEAALPIAQMDAQTQAQFEVQNLSNRQQRAMLAAQQRASFMGQEFDQAFQARVANAAKVSDIANMNFTAEQQVALENSRIANTVNLQNLSNRQAMVMAEAAALANMDMANLNNRQQAAVQNAQNFLAVEMTNLSNQQQTDLFKAQQRVQSLFTDQAAQNAAQQFNASSQNQVDQFFASLQTQTAQFNATQANAQAQFNAGQINTIERFNAEINNQRDQFNAQNRLIIDQSNAQWRREIATADTAAVNRANEMNATALLGVSQAAYNNLWQYYRDNMEWAWTSAENERQRVTNMAIAQLQADSAANIQNMKQDYQSSANFGSAVFKFLTTDISNSLLGGLFG
jgi:hypothetical protein